MAATDAKPFPIKNQAYRVTFAIYDADGDLVTGAAGLDSEISKDGAAFADCTNEATEIATSSGMYYLDLTATEMNADTVAIIVKTSTSGAKTTAIVMYPAEPTDIPANVTAWNGTAVPTPDTAGYPKVTIKDGTGVGELDTASGKVLLQDGSITAAVVGTGAIDADAIADNAIDAGAIAAGAITAAKFGAGAIDAAALAADAGAELADAFWDEVLESTLTGRQFMRIFMAVLAGESAGGGTGTITFRDLADTKNRMSATVDANRNRTTVTRDGS